MSDGLPKVTQLPRESRPGLWPSRVSAVHLVDRGKAEAGAREEPWWRWSAGADVASLFSSAQDPGFANQALISKKLNDYRKVR